MDAAPIVTTHHTLEIAHHRPHFYADFSTARANGLKTPVLGCGLIHTTPSKFFANIDSP